MNYELIILIEQFISPFPAQKRHHVTIIPVLQYKYYPSITYILFTRKLHYKFLYLTIESLLLWVKPFSVMILLTYKFTEIFALNFSLYHNYPRAYLDADFKAFQIYKKKKHSISWLATIKTIESISSNNKVEILPLTTVLVSLYLLVASYFVFLNCFCLLDDAKGQ